MMTEIEKKAMVRGAMNGEELIGYAMENATEEEAEKIASVLPDNNDSARSKLIKHAYVADCLTEILQHNA